MAHLPITRQDLVPIALLANHRPRLLGDRGKLLQVHGGHHLQKRYENEPDLRDVSSYRPYF